ncbi:MAG: DUF1460 domain-containing protein, partial [Acidobacteria bacterium]|nr:DUF1460 domain-containing protein [Acidobacteriota bacterium]
RMSVAANGASLSTEDRHFVQQLLKESQAYVTLRERLNFFSQRLQGRPYLSHPLIGSLAEPEQLVARMDGFDCVTYIETVLALAQARDVESYLQRLRAWRYAGGEVSYVKRLHYTTNWHRVHVEQGWLKDLTAFEGSVARTKILNRVPGVAPITETYRVYPRTKLNELMHRLQDGDLIYFGSPREGLDTYHVGMLFRVGDHLNGKWMMRHAARRQGQVTEQPLTEFFQQTPMSGFMLARPLG